MIIEIIFFILTFLITGYSIYRFGGEEENIEYEDNHLNNIYNPVNINNYNYNILNDNENNDTIFFKKQVIAIIQREEEKKNIDWEDLETTAKNIEEDLTYEAKSMVQDPFEEIKEILNEEKLKRGEEVVKKWIDKNKGKEVVKKWIDINSGFFMEKGFAEILKLIYNSEENTYMFKNIDTNKEEKKRLLLGSEIIVFLKKIRCDNKSLNIPNSSKNENIINNNEKKSFEEQVNEQIEKNIKNINWEDLPGAAQKIYDHLTKDAQRELNAFEKIENILKEKKSKGGEEAVKNWLEGNDVKNNTEDFNRIIVRFYNDKKANIYQNTYKEIVVILEEKCRDYLSNGQCNQLQTIYIELLEKEEEKKEREKKKLEEEKKKYDEEAELAKRILGQEPDIETPGVCYIKIKSVDRERSWERRFLKSDKISTLYVYAKSLGREIFMEPNATKFDILAGGFPPKSLKFKKNNTLEKEGLFPKAEVQITEE